MNQVEKAAGTVSGIVAGLGETIIDLETQRKAMAVLKESNQAMTDYLTGCADIFSPTDTFDPTKLTPCIASEVYSAYNQHLVQFDREFQILGSEAPKVAADQKSWLGKRTLLATSYRDQLLARDKAVLQVLQLRKAALKIIEAHKALAAGDKLTFQTSVQQALDTLTYVSTVYQKVSKS